MQKLKFFIIPNKYNSKTKNHYITVIGGFYIKNKIIFLSFLIIVLISLSCVNAEDTKSEILNSQNSDNDFSTFNDEIQSVPNKTLELTKDYSYNSENDVNYCGGITIDTDGFVIDGQGHTLDAKKRTKVFNIKSDNVVLKNLVVVNGKSDSLGGAISWIGNNATVDNCTFRECESLREGGAIYFKNSGTIINSCFENNNATLGGATSFDGNAVIISSKFTNNSATFLGGAIIFYESSVVKDTVFSKNIAGDGSGIYSYRNCIVENSTFMRNHAIGYGAITNDDYLKIINTTFIKNTGKYASAIFFKSNGHIENSTFTQNSAETDGIIYAAGTSIEIYATQFNHNEAKKGNSIHIMTKTATIKNSTFNNNMSTFDSEIYLTSENNVLINLSFKNTTKEEIIDEYDTKNETNNNTPTPIILTPSKTVKKSTYISAKSKTFKVKTKTKKYTITLKSGKTVLKSKKVSMKLRGKTYTLKTNKKGQVTFKLKITKKGKFKAILKFNGDKLYKLSKKTVYIKIKK